MSSIKEVRYGSSAVDLFLSTVNDELKHIKPKDNYFHIDVVTEAFVAGEKHGKEEFIKTFTEEFKNQSVNTFLFTQNLVNKLMKMNYKVHKFFINPIQFKSIIGVDNSLLLNDDFVDIAYSEATMLENNFNDLYDNLFEIGFIGIDNIKIDKIYSDGYVFIHEIK
ncbi:MULTISPECIES: hypothetical protein [Elizabethkingia]|uniref:hypothetical protein n=1 Tax=Elizabethkingia TaxID=308865 RepID=UPI0010C1F4FB|nr:MULTISPECIES: hypothetical protein [Elizabethkingia]QCO45774.1 hypothetical protein FCS00_05090 [Elizabethkingia sp. 2-6]WQM37673.1 hypothetical protein U2S95_15040 [Elizabethkingia miricola]DAN07586.1 MAG TPA: hypothetical protein [Crassvirales sp.]